MSKTQITKNVIRFIVGMATHSTVSAALRNNVDAEKPHQKVERFIGAAAVGILVSEAAESMIDKKVDAVVAIWNDAKTNKK